MEHTQDKHSLPRAVFPFEIIHSRPQQCRSSQHGTCWDFFHLDLRGARLHGARIESANLVASDLRESDLSAASLSDSDLIGADLRQADLKGTIFTDADLRLANLGGTKLSGARLLGADLRGAIFKDADFCAMYMGGTILGENDLSAAKGLDSVEHMSPSTIGIDTIYRSKGKIPESFLRGSGVPESFVAYMKSLVESASPIEFYSCFISYSSSDQEFAKELHTKLQTRNVRCWFAPEDLKIGDRFQERIEESIRLYDKLLVVLSENSVNSPWVEREVQAAFEKEQRQGSTVLFPVRLDDAVMDCSRAWAADIRRTRHIGNFHKWKDHDSFKKGFDRLLRDLKAHTLRKS